MPTTTYISGPYLRQYPAILNELKRLRILPDVRYVELTTKTTSEMGYIPQADEEVIDTTSPDFVKHFKGFTYVNPQQAVAVLHTDEKVPLTINEYIHYYSDPISEVELSREETEEIDAKVGRIHSQFTAIENEMTELLERVKELEHQAMDERLLAIIKAMARGPACYDDNSNSICVYCGTEWDHIHIAGFREIRHQPECPILLARTMLKELGIPMNIYRVASRYPSVKTEQRQYWRGLNFYTIATTLEEAAEEATKEYTWTKDMQVEFVQELPIPEEEE